jgi:NADH-quinone oxidoreductase subunit G
MNGRDPKLLMDIHSISQVNTVDLNEIQGPATGKTFSGDPHAVGHNPTDVKAGKGRNLEGTDTTNANTH